MEMNLFDFQAPPRADFLRKFSNLVPVKTGHAARRFGRRPGHLLMIDGLKWKAAVSRGGLVQAHCEDGRALSAYVPTILGISSSQWMWHKSWAPTSQDRFPPCKISEWIGGCLAVATKTREAA
jgi:hypothetical protein